MVWEQYSSSLHSDFSQRLSEVVKEWVLKNACTWGPLLLSLLKSGVLWRCLDLETLRRVCQRLEF